MAITRTIASVALVLLIVESSFGQPVTVPHTFQPGTPARAADVNENFSALAAGINANQAAIDSLSSGAPQIPAGSASSPAAIAVVARSGGDYASPLEAIANLSENDKWCRQPGSDPAAFPCVISIAPGVYELESTLLVPEFVAVIGSGPESTILQGKHGVRIAVQLGVATPTFPPRDRLMALRDLTVSSFGDESIAIALATVARSRADIVNVHAWAASFNEAVAVMDGDQAQNRFRLLQATASGGDGFANVGFKVGVNGSPVLEDCTISVENAHTLIGIAASPGDAGGGGGIWKINDCTISARGLSRGGNVTAVSAADAPRASVKISRSSLEATGGAQSNVGLQASAPNEIELIDVRVAANGAARSGTATAVSLQTVFRAHLERVNLLAIGGATNTALVLDGKTSDQSVVRIIASEIVGSNAPGGVGRAIRLRPGGPDVVIERSGIKGETAALFFDGANGAAESATLDVRLSGLLGILDLRGHPISCLGVHSSTMFYPSSCPP